MRSVLLGARLYHRSSLLEILQYQWLLTSDLLFQRYFLLFFDHGAGAGFDLCS
jgi:hypothetical protein